MRLRREENPGNRPGALGTRHDRRRDFQSAVRPLEEKRIELSADTKDDVVAPGRAEAGGDDASDCADPDDGDVTYRRVPRKNLRDSTEQR